MALTDEVQGRLGTQRLVELTNPGSASATTLDTTRLAYAAADAQAELELRAGVAYDGTKTTHVAVAVEGVVYYLQKRAGLSREALDRAERSWREALDALARTTGRDRIRPATTSVLTPSSEAHADGSEVRPDFDRERFGDLVPRAPLRSQADRTGGED